MCSGIFNSYNRFILSGITPVFSKSKPNSFYNLLNYSFCYPYIVVILWSACCRSCTADNSTATDLQTWFLKIPKINFSNKGSVKVIKLMGPAKLSVPPLFR